MPSSCMAACGGSGVEIAWERRGRWRLGMSRKGILSVSGLSTLFTAAGTSAVAGGTGLIPFPAHVVLMARRLSVSPSIAFKALFHFEAVVVELSFKQFCPNDYLLPDRLVLQCLGWEAYDCCSSGLSSLYSVLVPLGVVQPADSVDDDAWNDSFGFCADCFRYLVVFHRFSVLDSCCQWYPWYFHRVVLSKDLAAFHFCLV